MASNQTPNLGLSQWQRTDPFTMDEFNADYAKIDAALGAQPYQVLLRQTLTEDAPSILLDLSGIDFTEHPRLRLEVSGQISAPNGSGGDNICFWCNALTTGSYYYRAVNEITANSAASRYFAGQASYNAAGEAVLHLTADIMVGPSMVSFYRALAASTMESEGRLHGIAGYEHHG